MMPAVLAAALLAAAAVQTSEHQKTEAGVQATENHWSEAFLSGDAAYMEQLLDDSYVSVSKAGARRPKPEIIAAARKRAGMPRPSFVRIPPHIELRGDLAVVSFQGKEETSVDVFYWKAGAWRALYSQHTAFPAGAPGG